MNTGPSGPFSFLPTHLPTRSHGFFGLEDARPVDLQSDFIVDDPLKPDEALSEAQRARANAWFDHTVSSRLNDKKVGAVVIMMQRLHQDDLVGQCSSKVPRQRWYCRRSPRTIRPASTRACSDGTARPGTRATCCLPTVSRKKSWPKQATLGEYDYFKRLGSKKDNDERT